MEMRVAKRLEWFYNFYFEHSMSSPAGFILDISETGSLIWLNYPNTITYSLFNIVIHPPIESGIHEDIRLTLRKKWSEVTVTEVHEKIGCEFVEIENSEVNKLNSLLEFIEISEAKRAVVN